MIFAEITHSHPSQSSGYNNYYYNRLSKILKRTVFYSLYLISPKLLTGGFSSMEVQLSLPKFIFEIFSVPIISVVTLS